ncbi:aldehyde dehydrogenase (NAD+) [Defluviimonas denitrificans]|jgi:aldehyde dehydrogenase (NAD+)|uniref:aldehyde dehydrogenase (NAD(+)) n=1 Tax=Albidovulum denitrificans TaxID=404881 RepID=A0A2S8S8T8_9RHOB|nr:aldehyde dehydrogenase family protein [Defluviimonas denitrificans]PQV57206.1 aldehyde dehydrogenase (NAD+) [Defluviimonas denitrificans]
MSHKDVLKAAGLSEAEISGGTLAVHSPIDGAEAAKVRETTAAEMPAIIATSQEAFKAWRQVPAPRRGELVRLLGEELRASKEELGAVVTLEAGKILSEGLGEVQEMIDICDFAVGLSRQIYGLTIASERPGHRMMETWHPLGPCAVITAFNFPVAVWSWNTALALVCGDPVIWKPSEKTPLTAMVCMKILDRALKRFGDAPEGLVQLVIGGPDVGEALVNSKDVPIVSATGSTRMGGIVGPKVSARWGRPILELGGNNAMIVAPSADLDMAVRAIVFSAVGTAGQRCTSLRRLIAHNSIKDDLVARLVKAYGSLPIGDPRKGTTLIGPLIDHASRDRMQAALEQAKSEGGTIHGGKTVATGVPQGGAYVQPAVAEMPKQTDTVRTETFAPILYVMGYDTLDEAIAIQNDVPQGLSSCIFTLNMREAETFLSSVGSDCGIANVNIGPSGAEIGGAFGGEKETGGGRESGSDAWKGYMRRQTNTINYSADLPLAQGVKFDI